MVQIHGSKGSLLVRLGTKKARHLLHYPHHTEPEYTVTGGVGDGLSFVASLLVLTTGDTYTRTHSMAGTRGEAALEMLIHSVSGFHVQLYTLYLIRIR